MSTSPKHSYRPKKSWSQNFLIDSVIVADIVEACNIESDDVVVEIGAGTGNLTRGLLSHSAKVVAIEKDRDLAAILRGAFGDNEGVEIVEGNALGYDLAALRRHHDRRLILVGNLPYHLSGPIINYIIDERFHIKRVVFMLQKEVAERICAIPGKRDYGALTVLFGLHYDSELIMRVKPGAFRPRPKVDSAVIRVWPLESPRVDVPDLELFIRVVKAAFSVRRKMLRNALKNLVAEETEKGPGITQSHLDCAFGLSGIDPSRRAETLTLTEFRDLAAAFEHV